MAALEVPTRPFNDGDNFTKPPQPRISSLKTGDSKDDNSIADKVAKIPEKERSDRISKNMNLPNPQFLRKQSAIKNEGQCTRPPVIRVQMICVIYYSAIIRREVEEGAAEDKHNIIILLLRILGLALATIIINFIEASNRLLAHIIIFLSTKSQAKIKR